jgi:beta-glucanase (GH16 family)
VYFDDLALTQLSVSAYGNWNITWSDEFEGSSINPAVWTFDLGNGSGGWGNSEREYYTSRPQNAVVSGGLLHIIARQESFGGSSYTSARLKTQGLFSKTRGRFEFRAKLPQGAGFWPALWLLGTNIISVGWPACGEINVVENKGSNPGTIQGSLHSGSDETQTYNLPGRSVTNFHSYLLEWTTNTFNWFVDGLLYQTQTGWSSSLGAYPAPFDRPFFIIMNLAIGGSYLGYPTTNTINAGTSFPAEMQVDYVRIYEQTGPLQIAAFRTNAAVILTWPTNIICHLQMQTNSVAGDLASPWLDVAGAASPFVAPLANRTAFYRLASP